MATTTIKKYHTAPYYDDYNETKNYQRILFRPGYAVQARELTQLQTTLQAQIDRHGQYTFKHGSRVVDGKISLDIEYEFIKIESSFTHSTAGSLNTDSYLSQFVGQIITGTNDSGTEIKARVLNAVPATDTDPNTLYIKYINSGGSSRDVKTFAAEEEFNFAATGGNLVHGKVKPAVNNPTGKGSVVNIEEGVYFVSGNFIHVPSGSLILDKYTNTPSYTIGLRVDETIVDSGDDLSLKDNAAGTPNESAPGATRYQISTTLIKESLTDLNSTTDEYITLLRVKNGITQTNNIDTVDKEAELSKRLATRTLEESGNYSLNPYQLDIKEHDSDPDKFSLGIEPGVSYVQGFRNENIATNYIDIDKPRDEADSVNIDTGTNVGTPVGNYIKLTGTSIKGMPDLSDFATMNLYDAIDQGGSIVGTARARALEVIGGEYRLHIFDINMSSGSFSSVKSVAQNDASGVDFKANISDTSAIRYNTGQDGLLFKLPYTAVKTLKDPSDVSITEYTVKRDFSTTVTGNQVSISVPASQGHFTNINTATYISIGPSGIMQQASFVGGAPSDGDTSLTISATAANGTAVRIIADIEVDGSDKVEKEKTRQNNSVVSVSASSDDSYSLSKADIIRIVSVEDANNTDVTERFTLDNGQRDNFYDIGRILKTPGTSPVSDPLTITFDYYSHGNGDYFSVDSYPLDDYDTIPSFNSIQGLVELRDCIDFRSRKDDTGSDFTSTGASTSYAPDPSHAMSMYVKYYMPRIDTLYVTKEGEFKTATGVPSDYPKAPSAPVDTMAIYKLSYMPYVFDLNEITPSIITNKRYTMRDIGNIDKRLKNVEYYTSLSLLEQEASNRQLFDSNNFERTKNGFLVDSFRGHNIGDSANPDYQCSIDRGEGILRPKFDERNVNLVRETGDTGSIIKHTSLAMLPHTTETYINQPYSSIPINVNPYNIFTWTGTLKLSPESDEWKETDVRPDVIINDEGIYDQFLQMADEAGILGTDWNGWDTNWTGETGREVISVNVGSFQSGRGIPTTTTSSVTSTTEQTRSGIQTSITPSTVERELGEKVVEVNFVPFMRSRKISFKAELLKPDTKMYAYFNDVNVTAYCKQEAFQEFSDQSDVRTYEGFTSHPDSGSGTLTTDAGGNLSGTFIIPRNDVLQFKTGTRTFKFSDSHDGDINNETTIAETQFHAQGLIESVQKEIISTKVPQFVTTELNETRTLTNTTISSKTTWHDPLAQSMIIDTEGGVFAKSVTLYFRTKDDAIPVRVSIRSMVNGVPTQLIAPGSDTIVHPNNVNISEDASAETVVTFEHPVYLAQDQEYCIVLMAQCDTYESWVAEMGEFDKTIPENRITKQPYGGVFFTSQNSSTWTPDQNKDLKFKLDKCVFNSSGAEMTLVHDNIPAKLLPVNSMYSNNGSGTVTVYHKNHGMHNANNPVVIISGAETFNGLAATNLNGTHNITNVTHDTYVFTAGGGDTADATGSGGGSVTYATENRQIDLLQAKIEELVVPGTYIKYYMRPYSETEVADSAETEILPNTNVQFSAARSIASEANSASKTFKLRCEFHTTNSSLSPVIDMNRTSLFTIQNRISDNSTGDELSATGGNQLARYITKKIELAEEADKIDVFLNVNRPRASDVDLYWRVVDGGSSVDISTVNWTLATSTDAIPINDNPDMFTEIDYSIDPAGSFGTMQFKIVLRSTNSSTVPLVKDFRSIAST